MDDAQAPDVPGFVVGRLLGRGGSADVWLATEQHTGNVYALKCFHAAFRTGPGLALAEEEIRREIRILSVLDHPHLIRAHDAVPAAGPGRLTALTMDYAAGGSLAQLVAARGSLSVGETVTVLTPIAQALGYLHGKGFTHSDVAPGNILFTGQGKPMLSDLGVARMLGDPGGTGTAGTSGFLDPSPVDAVRAGLQPERDVYSLGALGWFCLTGDVPGRAVDRPPLPLLVPGVPRDLAAALEHGLNEDRRLRPTATALGAAIYRSAAPLPLDLSDAVHPTVLPELLTRRNIPNSTNGNALGSKLRSLRRRASTFGWPRWTLPAGTRPFSKPAVDAAPQGKHAAGPARAAAGSRPARAVVAAAAVAAAVAGVCWLSASGGAGLWRGEAAPGAAAGSATYVTAVPGAAHQDAGPAPADMLGEARQQAAAADPAVAVRGLAALRDNALNTGSVELLDAVNAPGSPAAAADQVVIGQLGSSGRLEGFATTLSEVATEPGSTQARAVIRLTSAASGYRAMSGEDAVQAAGTATPARPLRLVLVSVEGQWRISEILPGN